MGLEAGRLSPSLPYLYFHPGRKMSRIVFIIEVGRIESR